MTTLLWALFAADSVVNIYACAADRQRLRRISKILLMPLLLGAYLLSAPVIRPLVALGIAFGWLGDIFLIYKHDMRILTAGMISFGLGHVMYVIVIAGAMASRPALWAFIALPLLFAGGAAGTILYLRPHLPKGMTAPSLSYCLLLCATACSAALYLLGGNPGSVLMLCGGLLFLVSDMILSIETFVVGEKPVLDFAVMLTYIAAQALLVLGFLR